MPLHFTAKGASAKAGANAEQGRTRAATPGDRLRERQHALIERYRGDPAGARARHCGATRAERAVIGAPLDPQHSSVRVGVTPGLQVPIGLHPSLGGLSDFPAPGDLLCAALAACTDATLRMLANAHHVELSELCVDVEGDVDLTGALRIRAQAPVGFEALRVRIRIAAAKGSDPQQTRALVRVVENSSVVLQTLRNGAAVEIETRYLENS